MPDVASAKNAHAYTTFDNLTVKYKDITTQIAPNTEVTMMLSFFLFFNVMIPHNTETPSMALQYGTILLSQNTGVPATGSFDPGIASNAIFVVIPPTSMPHMKKATFKRVQPKIEPTIIAMPNSAMDVLQDDVSDGREECKTCAAKTVAPMPVEQDRNGFK